MKSRLLFAAFALSLAVHPGLRAQPKTDDPAPSAPPAASKPKKEKKEETELESKMEKMDKAWKKLRKQVADPASNGDSLQLVGVIRASAQESLKLTPAKAADVPEADRAKFVSDYQEKMKTFLAELDNLEAALKENRNEDAAKSVAKLNSIQREGHKAYRRPQQ